MNKICIYGLGNYFNNNVFEDSEILQETVCLCDSKTEGISSETKYGKPIISPEILKEKVDNGEVDKIVIANMKNRFEIGSKILSLGINQNIITMLEQYSYQNNTLKTRCINSEALKSSVILRNRNIALDYMPKNAITAEIGVAIGGFSSEILKRMNPQKFYALDLFDNYGWFKQLPDSEKQDFTHKTYYENKFKNYIDNGIMEVRQGLSWDLIAEFPDDYFDYIYLDACHVYETAKRDINAILPKIKNGGIFAFNDYGYRTGTCFGTYRAINDFINSGKHIVKYLALNHTSLHDIIIEVVK
jgi:hypothetical protein